MKRKLLPNRKPCVVVASIGRSGSTLVFQTLRSEAKTIWQSGSGKFEPTLANAPLKRGTICKTHDFPESLAGVGKPVKALFIFGSTFDAAISVHSCLDRFGADWVALHFEHLKSKRHPDELFDCDALGLGAHIKSWSTFGGVPTLCIRYEALWRHAEQISDFANYRFELPEFIARPEKVISKEQRDKGREVYSQMDDIIAALPDAFLAGPSMAPLVSKL